MILCFSGTGNSAYVAKVLAKELDDGIISINDRIKNDNTVAIHSDKDWVVVTPVYAWQMPHIVRDWLMKVEFFGSKNFYFVFTCGQDVGNAGGNAKALCAKKKWKYKGYAGVVMPENYIAMFKAPNKEESEEIVERAHRVIDSAVIRIKDGNLLKVRAVGNMDRFKSGTLNKGFYRFWVKADKFYAKDNCTSCGKCVEACPLNNISLKDGKPQWGKDCTHCMACICGCPVEAIEYGKNTRGKERYWCPRS